MIEILEAIKLKILSWLELDEKLPEENRDEILYLRSELTIAREEISRLTNLMYNASIKPNLVEDKIEEEFQPIRAKHNPWHVRRAQLEKDDRVKADQIRKEAEANKIIIKPSPVKSVEELENELEVNENDAVARS